MWHVSSFQVKMWYGSVKIDSNGAAGGGKTVVWHGSGFQRKHGTVVSQQQQQWCGRGKVHIAHGNGIRDTAECRERESGDGGARGEE